MENLISVEFPDADVQEIKTNILHIKGKLPQGLVTLTPEERRAYVKMGDKSIAFVEKALDTAQSFPQLLPVFVDIAEFKKDVEAVKVMKTILRQLEEITILLDDSILLAGSEALTAALSIYNVAKDAARRDVAGAKLVADELKVRFPGKKHKEEIPNA
jgi:hypothetical protein